LWKRNGRSGEKHAKTEKQKAYREARKRHTEVIKLSQYGAESRETEAKYDDSKCEYGKLRVIMRR
jgi:hypothetical protein